MRRLVLYSIICTLYKSHIRTAIITPYIYIYIYIYISYYKSVVVSKSLCGYVSSQVQYDMESAQYL